MSNTKITEKENNGKFNSGNNDTNGNNGNHRHNGNHGNQGNQSGDNSTGSLLIISPPGSGGDLLVMGVAHKVRVRDCQIL